MTKNNNVVWHHATIKGAHREKLNGHKSVALWFTGLSGSGKSTIKEFTGISASYEIPENPELHLKTDIYGLPITRKNLLPNVACFQQSKNL